MSLQLLMCLTLLAGPKSVAAPPAQDPVKLLADRDSAEAAYSAGDWKQASALYSALADGNPDDGELWWSLGRAQAHLGRHEEALSSCRRALALGGIDLPNGTFRIAEELAALGKSGEALAALEQALAAGYRHKPEIPSDPAFVSLRGDPRFVALTGAPFETHDRVRGWLHDLHTLEAEIRRVHFVYRDRPLPAAFLKDEAALRAELPKLSDAAVLLHLQRLVADLGDGHSLIYPAGMKRGSFHVLPLQLYWFTDGLFVVASSKHPELVGAKVLALGGLTPEALLDRVRPYISHDNPSELKWVSPGYLIIDELLRLVGVVDHGGIALRVKTRAGEIRSVKVPALERPATPEDYEVKLPAPPGIPAPLFWSKDVSANWFEPLPGGVMYVQFNAVQDGEHESLAELSRRLHQSLSRPELRGLVVDMRRNNGGEATLSPALLRTLVAFEVDRGGRSLVVLVGRDTFSAAQNFADRLQLLTHAVFVGEPTGSKPHHIGDEADFRLPYSGAVGQLAPGEHLDSLYRDDRIWIAPQVPVGLGSADYFAGRDPVLLAALRVLAINPR